MATITTVRSGNWSDTSHVTGPWPGGLTPTTLPTSADDVVVAKNTTLTIDVTTAVANSISEALGTTGADVGGILACTTGANWKLTLQNGQTGTATTNPSNTATYAGSVNFDMSGSSYVGEVVLNNANSTTDGVGIFRLYGNYTLKGKPRKSHTVIESALTSAVTTSVYVTDATGWKVGDTLIFATTSAYNATPRTDLVIIDSITFDNAPTNTGRAQITWSESLSYDHASDCPVGNFTSNLIFRPGTAYGRSSVWIGGGTNNLSADSYIDNVLFSAMRTSGFGANPLAFSGATTNRHKSVTSCAFYDWYGGNSHAIYLYNMRSSCVRNFNIFYTTQTANSSNILSGSDTNYGYDWGNDEDYAVFRASDGIVIVGPGQNQVRHKISGLVYVGSGSGSIRNLAAAEVNDCDLWSNYPYLVTQQRLDVNRCRFDSAVFPNATAGVGQIGALYSGECVATDCELPGSSVFPGINSGQKVSIQLVNRNADSGVQEFYQYQSTTVPAIQRTITSGEYNRATSGMEFTFNSSVAQPWAVDVLARSGQALKILLYIKKGATYKSGSYTEPSATLSGLGITPVVATATSSSDGAWELLTLDLAEGDAPATDGLLTLTLSAQSATGSAQCWFSGIPIAPFITRCRHYGYLFDETSPTRTVNVTIDPTISQATALAYGNSGTDLETTWGTALSTLAVKVDSTFKKIYHFTQSDAIGNVDKVLPLTGAGVADAPALFATGDVTITTTKKLNGSGSLALTGETATSGTTITLSADATNDKFTRASGDFTTDFAVGSFVTTSGFANSENNGTFLITALDATNMTVSAALTTETGGGDEEIVELTRISTEFLNAAFTGTDAYTYSNGTWSQASDIPTFSGGVLKIGAAGAYPFVQSASMTVVVEPTGASTYDFGDATFTGTLTVHNVTAHAITVQVPTGTTTSSTGNRGGAITFSAPVITADISITSMPDAGAVPTRLQIINKTALSASAWAANTVYATGALVKRSTGIGSESTAGLYFRATTGGTSHATTEPTWDTTVGNTTADGTVVWTCYAVLYYDTDPAATSLTDTYIDGEEFLDGEVAEIRFAEMNGATSFKTYSTEVAITAAGFSALVAEEADAVFATFAIDGSTLEATFSPNFTSDYIVMDSNTDFAGKGAFAYYCYTLTTSAGMYNFWGGVTALDEGNIRINTSILNLYFDESAGFVKQTDDVRIFRSDGTRPALDPTTGTHGIEINWRTPVSVVTTGGSAVLPQDIVDIAAASGTAAATATLAAAQTTPIHSDVRKVVGITVDGTGMDGDPWGPQ